MNQSHLTALYNVLETMPEGPDKQLIRELAGMAFNALKFASELEYELRTAAPEVAVPEPLDEDDQATELTDDQCANALDVLVQTGYDRLLLQGPIPHIDQVIDFYERIVGSALAATVVPQLTDSQRDIVFNAFNGLVAATVNAGGTDKEIDAIFAVEDAVLAQFSL